ncbi:ABC transporter D family member 2, chloroplastic [Physcomitrium patens]|uniref:Uncharacterized protein n=1 Tax=Physcomitrium patens TaxID=3218 RepID=A0A2K1KF95_PHYPA|nr:ABC transporter D family member 2, chloroplastic-like [Physcomitrium patens]PNR52450.1 hypothetical protein PHYPA_008824 [Physcomitrium patens]|eukprot:XP_024378905.1 ABC transporter D family member 2, chloroplastic-like [Physcomitrella patens]
MSVSCNSRQFISAPVSSPKIERCLLLRRACNRPAKCHTLCGSQITLSRRWLGGDGIMRFRRPNLYSSRISWEARRQRQRNLVLKSSLDSDSSTEGAESGDLGKPASSIKPTQSTFGHDIVSSTSSESELDGCIAEFLPPSEQQRRDSDLSTVLRRFWKVAAPYWSSEDKVKARLWLAGVFALTLATTGISVGFNFLGRDLYNALGSKDQEQFYNILVKYFVAFIGGIPVFVLRDYYRDTLALRWRGWMTTRYLDKYFENQTFYKIQSQSIIDNPDQRIVDDLNSFSGSALGFALSLFNAIVNLLSFSGILYGIYAPLFYVLLVYSIGGTALSVALGKNLVGLNFMQEKKEADFRYGLVRVRENAESIAFYGGESSEMQLLVQRFKQSFDNYTQLLIASRNLDFFTNFYRYLIRLLPASVVAPLYFAGQIEFGVINQSVSAFNNVLSDFSIIVYQFQSLSAFSAVIDRLSEFTDILEEQNSLSQATFQNTETSIDQPESSEPLTSSTSLSTARSRINLVDVQESPSTSHPLLVLENVTLYTPQYSMSLFKDLCLVVNEGENLLIMGASGSGKTSLLRAIAGLWRSGSGTIKRYVKHRVGGAEQDGVSDNNQSQSDKGLSPDKEWIAENGGLQVETNGASVQNAKSMGSGEVFFLPQRPYMVLGTLRQQLLYPRWSEVEMSGDTTNGSLPFLPKQDNTKPKVMRGLPPNDDQLVEALERVQLGHLMDRCDGLDSSVEWASVLSLGEQQRLAFARLLLSRPQLALMDESTSALDEKNEVSLYAAVQEAGITVVSVGHRNTLRRFHKIILQFEESSGSSGREWTISRIANADPAPGRVG